MGGVLVNPKPVMMISVFPRFGPILGDTSSNRLFGSSNRLFGVCLEVRLEVCLEVLEVYNGSFKA